MVPYCQRKEYELDILQEPLLLPRGEGKERVSENTDNFLMTEYESESLQEPLLLLQGEGKERVSENADHSLLTEERV